jgi:hypothetical protein
MAAHSRHQRLKYGYHARRRNLQVSSHIFGTCLWAFDLNIRQHEGRDRARVMVSETPLMVSIRPCSYASDNPRPRSSQQGTERWLLHAPCADVRARTAGTDKLLIDAMKACPLHSNAAFAGGVLDLSSSVSRNCAVRRRICRDRDGQPAATRNPTPRMPQASNNSDARMLYWDEGVCWP